MYIPRGSFVCLGEVRQLWCWGRGHPPVTPPKPVEPFPGYGEEDADILVGDELSHVVNWNSKTDLSSLTGREISIRIHMARAKLYSTSI